MSVIVCENLIRVNKYKDVIMQIKQIKQNSYIFYRKRFVNIFTIRYYILFRRKA